MTVDDMILATIHFGFRFNGGPLERAQQAAIGHQAIGLATPDLGPILSLAKELRTKKKPWDLNLGPPCASFCYCH